MLPWEQVVLAAVKHLRVVLIHWSTVSGVELATTPPVAHRRRMICIISLLRSSRIGLTGTVCPDLLALSRDLLQ